MFWTLVALLFAIIYFANKYYHSYWTRKGVFQKEPAFFFGSSHELIFHKQSVGEFAKNNYNKYKNHKVLGLYFQYNPLLIVNDPELVQDVMIRDFNSFHNRGIIYNPEVDPIADHLFNADGQKWRDLRVKLSPTFTSGKLKGMYPTIHKCAQTLEEYMLKNVKNGGDTFQMRDLMARYTTNVISSVAFGIDNDCINDPDHIFRQMGLKIFKFTPKQLLFQTLTFIAPKIFKLFQFKFVPQDIEDFFTSIVNQTIKHREASKENERKDFMQLMVQLKNQGYLSADKDDEESEKTNHTDVKKLTNMEITAQAFLFFAAGFETSSSTSNFCLLELAKNQDKQKKVHEEIDKVLKSTSLEHLTYETLKELKYLECCIDEALRIYPILSALTRECSKDHKFENHDLYVEKKTTVVIPVMGLQRDPKIYDNPMEFRPERFLDSPHGNGKGKGLFYLPFGDGPRICIGARMGKLQTKLGLAVLLSKFKFELADKSAHLKYKEPEYDYTQLVLTPTTEISFKVTPRF